MDFSILQEVGIGGLGLVAVVACFALWSARQNRLALLEHEKKCEERLRRIYNKLEQDHDANARDFLAITREIGEIKGLLKEK